MRSLLFLLGHRSTSRLRGTLSLLRRTTNTGTLFGLRTTTGHPGPDVWQGRIKGLPEEGSSRTTARCSSGRCSDPSPQTRTVRRRTTPPPYLPEVRDSTHVHHLYSSQTSPDPDSPVSDFSKSRVQVFASRTVGQTSRTFSERLQELTLPVYRSARDESGVPTGTEDPVRSPSPPSTLSLLPGGAWNGREEGLGYEPSGLYCLC